MIDYRIYSSAECPPELFSFRYRIYVEEMHRPQRYACHKTKTIRDPLDDTARQVVALNQGRVVACIRANLLREGPVGDYFDLYELGRLTPEELVDASVCTRLMVCPEFRKTAVSIDIFKRLYLFALDHRVATSFMDCNSHLVGFFQRFGYEFQFKRMHAEYGEVSVMRLDHFDFRRLIAIGSPFAQAARARLESAPTMAAVQRAC